MGCFSPDPPKPRNIAQEGRETLEAQIELAPDLFASEAEFRPKYADLDLSILTKMLQGTEEAPGLYQVGAEAQRQAALADVETIEQLGTRATDAIREASPQQAALLDELNEQVLGDLQYDTELDPELRREIQQGVRAGQTARGVGFGRSDIYEEAAALGSAGLNLRNQRRAQAMGLVNLNKSAQADPFLALLGRPSQAAGYATTGSGPQLFDPYSAYGADLYNTNYNAAAAAEIAGGNNLAALLSGGTSAGGMVAGGFLAGR